MTGRLPPAPPAELQRRGISGVVESPAAAQLHVRGAGQHLALLFGREVIDRLQQRAAERAEGGRRG